VSRGPARPPTAPVDEGGCRDGPAWFRHVLGRYPTGVTVVTAMGAADIPVGMVIGSFTSVSLDPQLVAFLPGRSSTTWPQIMASGAFCVNVLSADQERLCRDFTAKAPESLDHHRWRRASSGSPILSGVLAWIDCDIADVQITGDHYLVLGRVRELGVEETIAAPLVFYQGRLGPLESHRARDGALVPAYAHQRADWI
jgi:3-hydroxy-9,10-secoandrosta-1,3,5(10)-triene-9,17-dione monooxygenase reductase component